MPAASSIWLGALVGAAGTGRGSPTMPPSSHDVSDGRISVAICPGEVRAACTATAASAPPVRDERAVIGGLVAGDIDDGSVGAPGVVQVGQAVCQARPTMQQRRSGLARHARI